MANSHVLGSCTNIRTSSTQPIAISAIPTVVLISTLPITALLISPALRS